MLNVAGVPSRELLKYLMQQILVYYDLNLQIQHALFFKIKCLEYLLSSKKNKNKN